MAKCLGNMSIISGIYDIEYDKKRVNIRLDSGECVRMHKNTVKEYGIKEGMSCTFDELSRIAKEGEEHIAFTTAIDSLSRGLKSQNEIKRNLKTKKFSNEAVDSTIDKLIGYNYLGDKEYAEAYISYKSHKYGRRKIIYDMVTIKGIDKAVAEEVAYNKLTDEEELEKAIEMATKYVEKESKKRTNIKEKTYCFLATRGFDSDIISSALSKIEFPNE